MDRSGRMKQVKVSGSESTVSVKTGGSPRGCVTGNNHEVQVPNLDVSMQINSEGNLHENDFFSKSKIFNNEDLQLGNGCYYAYAAPFRSLVNYSYHSGNQSGDFSSADNIPQQQSMLLNKHPSFPQFEATTNARKRPIIEGNDVLSKIGITDMVRDVTTLNEWKKNKRNKGITTSHEQQWQRIRRSSASILLDNEEHRFHDHVPVPRSQKLSDQITALQKLVSPYGKTATASVLQEASVYIRLLHEQIQNLYQKLSSSYKNTIRAGQRQEIGEEQPDLRSKGLCLVPVSLITQKVKFNGETR